MRARSSGQVGDAWAVARNESVAGPVLSILFRHALEVGKRVRSETAISRGTTSLSQTAVALARAELGSLSGVTTLVLGAGEMGEAMAQALAGGLETGALLVANRTWTKATELAARCGGRAIDWVSLPQALLQADVLLASTGSPGILLESADRKPIMEARQGRPLLIIDIAVPRDVDPAVGGLPSVTLLDMDDLSVFASSAMENRRQEVPRAERIVAEEVARYMGRLDRTPCGASRRRPPRAGGGDSGFRDAPLPRPAGRSGHEAEIRAVEALTRVSSASSSTIRRST